MSKDIAKVKEQEKIELSAIEQVVMQGDLSKLTSNQRVIYYKQVCESIGLNPYTRPFEYIVLNGKLTLYTRKDATEQLRGIKNISITALEGKMIDDLFIVTAKAMMPNGRVDQSTGAVTVGNLRGDSKANAIMKAETKAKRRVTLSISGLGFVDESEIDSIPNAKLVKVCAETGEIEDKNILTLETVKESPIVQEAKPEELPQQIDYTKTQGYAEFCEKYGLNEPETLCYDFITLSANKCNMTREKCIYSAMQKEDAFLEKFHVWKKNALNEVETSKA